MKNEMRRFMKNTNVRKDEIFNRLFNNRCDMKTKTANQLIRRSIFILDLIKIRQPFSAFSSSQALRLSIPAFSLPFCHRF